MSRPNRLGRLMVRFWDGVFARGWVMPERVATLEVRGRASGRTIALPVVIADHDGGRYLVSMLGGQANWVRNVRAACGRAVAPGARAHMPLDYRAPLREFEPIAGRFPVFRVVPV